MSLRVDLLQRTQVSHGTKARSVSDFTFGNNVATRFREHRRIHQEHELNSCLPPILPAAHVCAAGLRRRDVEADAHSRRLALPPVQLGRETL